jgi:hypothetical protein
MTQHHLKKPVISTAEGCPDNLGSSWVGGQWRPASCCSSDNARCGWYVDAETTADTKASCIQALETSSACPIPLWLVGQQEHRAQHSLQRHASTPDTHGG